MVRVALVSVGSRGDIQPYCVLGQAFAAQGHDVTIVTEKRLQRLVEDEFKLPVNVIEGDFCAFFHERATIDRLKTAGFLDTLAILGTWNKGYDLGVVAASYETALAGADIVITGIISMTESYCVAEKLRQVWVPLFLGNAVMPTRSFPHCLFDKWTCGIPWLNKLTHTFSFEQLWSKQARYIGPWRRDVLKLPPITSKLGVVDAILTNDAIHAYQCCSTLLAGPTRGPPADVAPTKAIYTGFLFPEAGATGPPLLHAFLAQARVDDVPVIYLGFGSMTAVDARTLYDIAVQVCHTAKCRCVFVSGWSSSCATDCHVIEEASPSVWVEPSAPHPWLFPQMRCILHHAGMGTTAAALQSGVPQIPCPIVGDQFHNAAEMVHLGVALTVVSQKEFTSARVTQAVAAVLRNDKDVQVKAKSMGEFVTKESDGNAARLCASILTTKPTFE
ncbi:Aste57867_1212 [Aphanomyces stellatus]|uniref:Aste57867_1212 protein n=1 Tax=Aphanomyces stellatus TaxID=120398 RepID=A0A485K5W3_9STRA|nr:hypothetical protein As57867_001211 [Aphanomyces stellatus]VFT78432.1 Aste57867_1212 [Aphanomyces stellatus]